jgi:hypothetical protein
VIRPVRGLVIAALVVAIGVVIAVAAASGGTPITQTDAVAFIRVVNLQPSDLPGSVPFQGESGSGPDKAEVQHGLHCGHEGDARGVAVAAASAPLSIRSLHGTKPVGEDLVASSVVVMPSETLAKAELATLVSRSGRACVAHDLRLSGLGSGGPHAPVYALKVTRVPVADTLGHEAIDLHLVARLQESRHRVPPPARFVYSIEALFRVGAADIVFYTLSERRGFPAATEARLLSLLHGRAEIHVP